MSIDIAIELLYITNELDFCGKATEVIRCTYRIGFFFIAPCTDRANIMLAKTLDRKVQGKSKVPRNSKKP